MDLFGDLPEPLSTIVSKSSNVGEMSGETEVRNDGNEFLKSGKRCLEGGTDGCSQAKKLTTDVVYQLKGYVTDRRGEREEMQDAHTIVENFLPEIGHLSGQLSRVAYYAVFDGHGGTKASKYAAEHLHKIITQKFPKVMEGFEKEMRRCLVESFKKLDDDFLHEAKLKKPSWKDGTTVVSVLAINNTLYIANLGDSKAVLCRYNTSLNRYSAIPLTVDHNPTLYDERMRIQKAGGHVRDGRVMGVLEVSRSVGDGPFKKHGLSCVPDVKRCQLTDDDRFVLIACDGLWKRFDNDTAIQFVNEILTDASIKATDSKDVNEVRWETATNRLANEAVRRLSADNVTVLLINIQQCITTH